MTEIKWYPVNEYGQELSSRLGFTEEKSEFVCCQEIYDIAWNTIKLMYKEWKKLYKDRDPHYDEFLRTWMLKYKFNDRIYDTKYYRNLPELHKIVKSAHKKIFNFYKKHLNRTPEIPEIWGAFRQSNINPNFVYDNKNWNRIDSKLVKYCKTFKVGKCVYCGKPVNAYTIVGEELILSGAGWIEMYFGYGSTRDLDNGKGFIHDECSKILEKEIFKKRFQCKPTDWSNLFGKSVTKKEMMDI